MSCRFFKAYKILWSTEYMNDFINLGFIWYAPQLKFNNNISLSYLTQSKLLKISKTRTESTKTLVFQCELLATQCERTIFEGDKFFLNFSMYS